MSNSTKTPASKSWRDVLPIHDACEQIPPALEEELHAIGEDFKKYGQREHARIVLWKEQKHLPLSLLDGRSRLDALERAGFTIRVDSVGECDPQIELWVRASPKHMWVQIDVVTVRGDEHGGDPYAYVISANLRRRQVTSEARDKLISKLLKAHPEKSDRQIAKDSNSNRTTVGQIRKKLENTGDVSIVDTRTDTKGRNQPATKPKSKPGGNDTDPQESAERRKSEAQTDLEDFTGPPPPGKPTLWLPTHTGELVAYPQPQGKATFNRTNEQVSWSAWTWNPVTGCIHGCKYCYARELALKPSYRETYPAGFTPLFHCERLDAPANTKVPDEAASDPRLKRVFVCSMADLYGKWVPDEWIDRVHASCIENPQWDYLLLTKFPRKYVGLKLPPTAWVGTSVDQQKRVRLAEDAFRQIKDVRVKWLSLEPLLAPLEFTDLSMFDWVVIGSQSATEQPDGHVNEFAPPIKWVSRLIDQAQEAGCGVYCKPNLLGVISPQSPGMTLPMEQPRPPTAASREAAE
jgi:protein gp37